MKEMILFTENEINEGIEEANRIIERELSFGDLADLNRVAKYNKYVADMSELKTRLRMNELNTLI